MQDPDPKCRHFGILWQFDIFAKKSNRKSDPIFLILSDFFRFLDFSRLSDSTALVRSQDPNNSPDARGHVYSRVRLTVLCWQNSDASSDALKMFQDSWSKSLQHKLSEYA